MKGYESVSSVIRKSTTSRVTFYKLIRLGIIPEPEKTATGFVRGYAKYQVPQLLETIKQNTGNNND